MNTTATHRFVALTFAFVMTAAMLAGVNGLAVSDAPDALLARVAASHQA